MNTKHLKQKLQDCKTWEQFNALLKEFDGQDIGGRLAFNFKTKTAYIAAEDDITRKILQARQAIGQRLKSEREKAGISKYRMYAEGLNQRNLKSIETGCSPFTIDSVIKYISVVGISTELIENIANDLEFLNPKPVKSVVDCNINELSLNIAGFLLLLERWIEKSEGDERDIFLDAKEQIGTITAKIGGEQFGNSEQFRNYLRSIMKETYKLASVLGLI